MEGGCTNEAAEGGAHGPALADPRAHPRLPARGCVGVADAGRPGRLPSAGAAVRFGPPVAEFARSRPHALGAAMEARGSARLGRPGRRPRLQGAHAARTTADRSVRRPTRTGV